MIFIMVAFGIIPRCIKDTTGAWREQARDSKDGNAGAVRTNDTPFVFGSEGEPFLMGVCHRRRLQWNYDMSERRVKE